MAMLFIEPRRMDGTTEAILSKAIDQLPHTVVDVETTGLNPNLGHRVCEIALVRYLGQEELQRFDTLINPRRPISPGAFAVNGITDAMVEGAPLFREVTDQVLQLLDEAVLVAHNAPFDLGFLSNELQIADRPPLENPVVDTLSLARRCFYFPSNSLGAIARRFGLPRQKHRALDDVLKTKTVLDRFLSDLREQGIVTLRELIQAQGGPIAPPRQESIALPPEIDEALQGGSLLHLRYLSSKGEETERWVEPLTVTADRGRTYLIAYCQLREAQRSFRLDRILEMRPE